VGKFPPKWVGKFGAKQVGKFPPKWVVKFGAKYTNNKYTANYGFAANRSLNAAADSKANVSANKK